MQTLGTLPNMKCTHPFKSKKNFLWLFLRCCWFSFFPAITRCLSNCAFIYKWKSVSQHCTFRPVGPGLCWEGVQSGCVSDSSCCLSEMWTSRWPDHTRSRAASEALLALPPPPDQTDIFYKRFRKNKQWHVFFPFIWKDYICQWHTSRDSGLFFFALLNSDKQKPPRALLCATLIVSSVM